MQNARYFGYLKNTSSALVRLGKTERKLKMKKLINWIWSKKNEEVEVYEVPQWESYAAKVERFNADHGLPLDQLVG